MGFITFYYLFRAYILCECYYARKYQSKHFHKINRKNPKTSWGRAMPSSFPAEWHRLNSLQRQHNMLPKLLKFLWCLRCSKYVSCLKT